VSIFIILKVAKYKRLANGKTQSFWHTSRLLPDKACKDLILANNLCSQRIESLFNLLIAPINLLNIVNNAGAIGR